MNLLAAFLEVFSGRFQLFSIGKRVTLFGLQCQFDSSKTRKHLLFGFQRRYLWKTSPKTHLITQNKQIRHVCFFPGNIFPGCEGFFPTTIPKTFKEKTPGESIPRVRFRWNGRNFHHRTLWVTARSNVLGRNRFRFTPTWCAARRFLNSIRHPFFFSEVCFWWDMELLQVVDGFRVVDAACRVNWSCGSFGEFLAILGMFGRSVLRCNRLHLPRWQLMKLLINTSCQEVSTALSLEGLFVDKYPLVGCFVFSLTMLLVVATKEGSNGIDGRLQRKNGGCLFLEAWKSKSTI